MSGALPEALTDAFQRLCQGEFSYRLPRNLARDEADTTAFYFNGIAEEIERIVRTTREQEQRLATAIERLSATLVAVAAGDFAAQVERDFRGDPVDVLAFLVNNTISELGTLVAERQRQSEQMQRRLEQLVEARTQELRESEGTLRSLFEAAPIGLILTSLVDNTILSANRAASQLFGTPLEEAVGRPAPSFYADPQDRERLLAQLQVGGGRVDDFELRFRRPDGTLFWASASVRTVKVGGKPALLSGIRDVTLQRQAEAQLRELATTDALTGLLNRRRLFEVAREELERTERHRHPLAVAMVDIDHFKSINDRFGHQQGDLVLTRVAQTLRAEVRKYDVVGRYGGEEFAVILPETTAQGARDVLERVRLAVERLELQAPNGRVPVSVSSGVVEREGAEPLPQALNRADEALYAAKRGGRNRVVVA